MAINTLMPKSHYSRWALSLKVGDCKPWNPGRRGLELWGFPWINIIWWRCGRCNDGQEFTRSLSKALSWSHRLRGTAGKLMARFQYQQPQHWFEKKTYSCATTSPARYVFVSLRGDQGPEILLPFGKQVSLRCWCWWWHPRNHIITSSLVICSNS